MDESCHECGCVTLHAWIAGVEPAMPHFTAHTHMRMYTRAPTCMFVDVCVHVRAYTHTHMHTHTHTNKGTPMHIAMHIAPMHIAMHKAPRHNNKVQSCQCSQCITITSTHLRTYPPTYSLNYTRTHAHAHKYTRTHARTHARKHTYMNACRRRRRCNTNQTQTQT